MNIRADCSQQTRMFRTIILHLKEVDQMPALGRTGRGGVWIVVVDIQHLNSDGKLIAGSAASQ